MQRTTTQRPLDPVAFTTTRPRPGGGGRGRPWRLGTRLRTTVRRGLLACLGVVGLAGVAGCQDCDERFCRGVRLATVQMMAASAECCAGAEDPACPDLERRFDELVRALHEAHDACEAGNFERLRELLESILGSLPRMFLLGFCGVDVDLGDWLEEACHPYVNATTGFLPGDELATSIRLLESGGHAYVFATQVGQRTRSLGLPHALGPFDLLHRLSRRRASTSPSRRGGHSSCRAPRRSSRRK